MTEQERVREKVRRLALELLKWPKAIWENPGLPYRRQWKPYNQIVDTWYVVDKLRETGYRLLLFDWGHANQEGYVWMATFTVKATGQERTGGGATEMEAICEAALAVLDAGDD